VSRGQRSLHDLDLLAPVTFAGAGGRAGAFGAADVSQLAAGFLGHFCILDEVDAPLDDANIDRFTRILKKFSDNTQFIVVTHNKRTMEAANALYGVTMEEEGVSKLVTVRFNLSATVQSAALASA
jgi:DNA repair ATPase RecN